MTRGVIDIEAYHNFFSATARDYDGEDIVVFEVSERKNEILELYSYLTSIKYLIGFNLLGYDSIMLNYIVQDIKRLMKLSTLDLTESLKRMNDMIISDREGSYQAYSKYKWRQPWINIDLFTYWSKMLRMSKKLSLKSFQVAMNWPRVQELPIHYNAMIGLEQIDPMLEYNLNDVDSTKALANKLSKEINLRVSAMKKYNFSTDCLSWDGVKLGLNIIIARYCQRTGIDPRDMKEMRSPRISINIGDLILPEINFKKGDISSRVFVEKKVLVTEFKSFYGLFVYLNNLTVKTTKEINCRVMLDGNRYDVKSGGLHTYHNGSVIVPKDDEYYEDIDVSSYYPTLGAMWNFIPEHLGVECAEELDSIRLERLDLKARGLGKSPDSELLKLAMNGGFYGNTNNEYTPMYDPKCMLSITINGQLMLLMLCEWLMDAGARIDMCNTDGITILYKKTLEPKVKALITKWEGITRMQMESVRYSKVVRMNINNYLAFHEDGSKPKEKGMFMVNPPIDASRDALVIAKALKSYFEKGTDIDTFIRDHKDIYDFCLSQKVDKKYTVYWNGNPQQRLNRYYIVDSGAYLYKSEDGVNMENLMKGFSVELFNDYVEKSDYKINYGYYISEAKKLLNELQPTQLSLI